MMSAQALSPQLRAPAPGVSPAQGSFVKLARASPEKRCKQDRWPGQA
jgi:hypothetical protein